MVRKGSPVRVRQRALSEVAARDRFRCFPVGVASTLRPHRGSVLEALRQGRGTLFARWRAASRERAGREVALQPQLWDLQLDLGRPRAPPAGAIAVAMRRAILGTA